LILDWGQQAHNALENGALVEDIIALDAKTVSRNLQHLKTTRKSNTRSVNRWMKNSKRYLRLRGDQKNDTTRISDD